MKLKIRYENEVETIELDSNEVDEMWAFLSLESDAFMTLEQRQELIQHEFNEQFNKPDYNCFHKFNRHRGFSKAGASDEADTLDISEPLMEEVKDPTIFYKEELEREEEWEYEAVCESLYKILKPSAASMVIAVALDGLSVGEYAASIGENANNVSHRYRRALNKLRKIFVKTSF